MDNIPIPPIEENNQTEPHSLSKKSIWISSIVVLLVIVGTFLILKGQSSSNIVSDTIQPSVPESPYVNDGQDVYYDGTKIIGADPETFTIDTDPSNTYDAYDKNYFYNYGEFFTE